MEELQKEEIVEETEEKKWCVYMHTNKHNNKVYVGITNQKPERRWRRGYGYLTKHQNGKYNQPLMAHAVLKYDDWDNDWEHIIFQDNLKKEEATKIEILLIKLYNTQNSKYGYNLSSGGEFGGSGAHHPCSDEQKRRISEANKGRVFSEDARKRMSENHADFSGDKNPNYGNHKLAGENHPNYGKSLSEDCRRKIGERHKNLWKNQQYRENLINKLKARYADPRNHPKYGKGKCVVQLDLDGNFIAEYNTIVEASSITNILKEGISQCCRHDNKSAGGFQWVFKDEWNPNVKQSFVDKKEKKVIQLTLNGEFIAEYPTITEACKQTGAGSHIGDCCRGDRKKAGGFRWMYKEEYEKLITQND